MEKYYTVQWHHSKALRIHLPSSRDSCQCMGTRLAGKMLAFSSALLIASTPFLLICNIVVQRTVFGAVVAGDQLVALMHPRGTDLHTRGTLHSHIASVELSK